MLGVGTTLGPYKILSPIGAGGMGEVYRARDTRLERDVAIKVLPGDRAATPEARARFEREARSISQLNHPHICTLHDVGRQDGIDYLVMELLDGESLARRLERGPLPLADVLTIGQQIADALDRAHRAGVVHRDLKPGNIVLTKGGAKLVDFGLARTHGAGPLPGAPSQAPTLSRSLTTEGTIVGTVRYMSPEQLEGKDTDARSDVWALGCVLYEMATGSPAFDGDSHASLIASIFKEQPRPMIDLTPLTPPSLDRLVRACMAKDPDQRVQAAHDVGLELQWIGEGSGFSASPARRPPLVQAAALVAALIAVALAGGWALRGGLAPTDRDVRRLSIVPPGDLVVRQMSFSADGKAFHALCRQRGTAGASARAIWRREIGRFDWTKLAGSEGAEDWQDLRDGRSLYVVVPVVEGSREKELRRLPVDGSAPATKVMSWSVDYHAWSVFPDGRLLVVDRECTRYALLTPGAAQAPSWRPLRSEQEIAELGYLQALPDGRSALGQANYYRASNWYETCCVLDLETGKLTILEENASCPTLLEGNRIVMTRHGTVLAARWDPRARRLASRPVAVLDGLRSDQAWLNAYLAVSPTGDLGYVPGGVSASQRSLAVVRPDGRIEPWNDIRSAFERAPQASPDGRYVVVSEVPPGSAVWQVTIVQRSPALVHRFVGIEGEDCFDARVAPNGREMVWIRMGRDSTSGLWLSPIGGESPARRIHAALGLFAEGTPAWYPDGRSILANPVTEEGRRVLLRVTPASDGASVSDVVRESYDVGSGSISPDGTRIAYVSFERGEGEIVVASLRSDGRAGDPVPVSSSAGIKPQWADNTTVLWSTVDLSVMAATVSPALEVSAPTQRFDLSPWLRSPEEFQPLADGSLLITRKAEGEGEVRRFDVVLNYRGELDRALKQAELAAR